MKKLFVIIVLFAILFCSCESSSEIDTLGIVAGMAFDGASRSGEVDLSVCILKANGEYGAEGNEGSGFTVISAEEKTLEQAKSALSLKAERKPFFGHNNIFFVSDDADISYIVPALYDDIETRGAEFIIMCLGKASDVFYAENYMGGVSSVSIFEMLEHADRNSLIKPVSIHNVIKEMNSPSQSCIVPLGRTFDKKFEFMGMCVLNDYEFKGLLDEQETFGALCVLDSIDKHVLSVKGKAVKISDAKTNFKYAKGFFAIDIYHEIKGDVTVEDYEYYTKKSVLKAIDAIKEFNSDFLGFRDEYYRETGNDELDINDMDIIISVNAKDAGGGFD